MCLAQALQNRGHEVTVISFKRQYPRWLFPGKSDRDPSRRPLIDISAEMILDSLWPPSWVQVARRIVHERPEVVVFQWWTTFWAPVWNVIHVALRVWRSSARIVYICHNVLPHETRPWDRWLAKMTLRWGERFIVQSAQEKERLLALLPLAESAVQVVPHPVQKAFQHSRVTRSEARRVLNLADDAIVLLSFGIVRPYKGLEDLIRALPYVVRQEPRVKLIVAGEFWEPVSKYQRLIAELGLQDHVYIDNRYIPDEEVPYYFAATDYFVASHRAVTGSSSIQVARGFGVPIMDRQSWGERARTPQGVAECILAYLQGEQSTSGDEVQVTWDELAACVTGCVTV